MAKNIETKTREEREAIMVTAKAEAESLVIRYNELTQAAWDGKEYDPKELVDVQEKIDAACTDYNNESRIITYLDCKAIADKYGILPSEAAAELLRYPVLSTNDSRVDKELCPVREVILKQRDISLIDMDKTLGGGVCASNDWQTVARRLNHLLVFAACVQIGADYKQVRDCLSLKEIDDAIKRGERPLGRENMNAEFKKALRAIIGESFEESWDSDTGRVDVDGNPLTVGDTVVNEVVRVFTKKGKRALSVVCGNHKVSVQLLMDSAHKLITGKSYTVESKEIKDPKDEQKKPEKSTLDPELVSIVGDLDPDQVKELAKILRGMKKNAEEIAA